LTVSCDPNLPRPTPLPGSGRGERKKRRTSRPVSRVLCPSSLAGRRVTAIHLGPPLPAASSGLPAGSDGPPSSACAGSLAGPLLDLAPGGVYLAAHVTVGAGELLPHLFTLTTGGPVAVCFLWHFPAGHPGSVLPTTLPCGARTFLDGDRSPTRPSGRLVRRTYDDSGFAVVPDRKSTRLNSSHVKMSYAG